MNDVDAAWKRAVDVGAEVKMPLADMFWGDRTGALIDPFGHKWSLAQAKQQLTPQEIEQGQKEFFAQMAKQGGPKKK